MRTTTTVTASPPSALDELDRSLEGRDALVQGVFEPPSGFVLAAIARNKLLVGVVAVAIALLGALYGLSRPKTYTASATLQVGQVNPNSPGFFGYVQSASSLATAFSRSIEAEPVLAAVHKKLNLAPSVAVGRLSSEPLPGSPAFRVIGTGPTASAAIALTNVAAGAVIAYESESNNANPAAQSLLHEYRDATVVLHGIIVKFASLGGGKSTPQSVAKVAKLEAERNAEQVKLKAITEAYVNTVTSQAPRSGLVSLVAGAASASSNRSSKVQLFGVVGLLAGIVLGCLAAALRERLRAARRRAAGRKVEMPRPEPA